MYHFCYRLKYLTRYAILFVCMKLNIFQIKKTSINKRKKRIVADFAQEQINTYGRKQLKSLIDRGLSVQWY